MLQGYHSSRVLACAPSNSAADLILERVAEQKIIPRSQMVRLNAFGRNVSSVNQKILVRVLSCYHNEISPQNYGQYCRHYKLQFPKL